MWGLVESSGKGSNKGVPLLYVFLFIFKIPLYHLAHIVRVIGNFYGLYIEERSFWRPLGSFYGLHIEERSSWRPLGSFYGLHIENRSCWRPLGSFYGLHIEKLSCWRRLGSFYGLHIEKRSCWRPLMIFGQQSAGTSCKDNTGQGMGQRTLKFPVRTYCRIIPH